MTKQSRNDVECLLNNWAWILRIAGVPEQQINVCKGPRYKVNHFVKAFDWLHEFILSAEMVEWQLIRAMRVEATWAHYDLMEVEGLQEQILLQEASKNLLKRWRQKRPRMFGPDREIKDDKDDRSNVQSDQSDSAELCV
jgi:hypothetical protein